VETQILDIIRKALTVAGPLQPRWPILTCRRFTREQQLCSYTITLRFMGTIGPSFEQI
jgi:hypothetical protein